MAMASVDSAQIRAYKVAFQDIVYIVVHWMMKVVVEGVQEY